MRVCAARLRTNERRQREHELAEALAAARRLQARLELLGDHKTAVHLVQVVRNGLAHELATLPTQNEDPA